jgi:hypothetical protein
MRARPAGSAEGGRPAAARAWPAGLAWALWALTLAGLAGAFWLDDLMRQAGGAEADRLKAAAWPVVLAAVSAATVGAVVASRRHRHPVGWLLLATGLTIVADLGVNGYVRYGVVARPGSLPGARYLAGVSFGIFLVWVSLAGFVLLLTPTGSLPSPRWRRWARVAAAGPVLELLSAAIDPQPLYPEHPEVGNPLAVAALRPVQVAAGVVGGALILVSLVVAAVSLVLRYRRAHGVERLQLRWLAFAARLAAGLLVVAVVAGLAGGDAVVLAVLGAMVALLPLATGAAILRYRLYDLDRIISRTVAYGLLTVLLGLGYAAVVLGLGRLLPDSSSLAVAAATLAVAAVFQPARRRVQALVDRRFNRRRHDAAQIIEAFGARLRGQVDLDALHGELLAVVDQTMQPTQASLWLRPQGPPTTITSSVVGPLAAVE